MNTIYVAYYNNSVAVVVNSVKVGLAPDQRELLIEKIKICKSSMFSCDFYGPDNCKVQRATV
jgi:hypothetical protein